MHEVALQVFKRCVKSTAILSVKLLLISHILSFRQECTYRPTCARDALQAFSGSIELPFPWWSQLDYWSVDFKSQRGSTNPCLRGLASTLSKTYAKRATEANRVSCAEVITRD